MSRQFNEISSGNLKKLHEIQVEILDEVVKICTKYKLKYYLVGGTLLGAVRHGGFIPWDDDLDIAMTRDDFEKFLEIAPYEMDDKYYLETRKYNKNFFLQYAKIKKNNTDFKENFIDSLNIHKGIFIDIFPLDNICKKNGVFSRIRNILVAYSKQVVFVKLKLMKVTECWRPFVCFIYSLLPLNLIYKIQYYLITKDRNKNTKYYTSFVGTYPIEREIFDKSMLEQTKILFEGKKYTTFKNYELYLERLYGDYMTLPPKEERVNHCPDDIDFDHGMDIKTIDLINENNV